MPYQYGYYYRHRGSTNLMHHPVLGRSFPVPLFVAAALGVLLMVAVAYSAVTMVVPTGGPTPSRSMTSSLHAAPISEDEANKLVWSLPEVQAAADQLRAHGSRPITYTAARPLPTAATGSKQADYVIDFAEDTDGHVTTVYTFEVDPYTKQISVYDVIQDRAISLDQWRAARR